MKGTTGILAILYGRSGTGKSTCTGAAGSCGLFIAQGGGLLPLKNYLGLEKLNVQKSLDVESAAKIVLAEAGKHPSIVIDDFSLLVERTVSQLEKKHSFGDMWRALRAQVLGMRDSAREATEKGTHVFFNCHESSPRESSGKFVRGGPALPGQLPEQFSAFSDVVARVVYDETAAPWKFVLNTTSNSKNIGGDRLAIFPPSAPMNLAEALRVSGYQMERPKNLAWQEAVVEGLSNKILEEGIEKWREVLRPAVDKLSTKYPKPHVRWALQDSLHRAILKKSKEDMVDDFLNDNDDEW